MKTPIIVTNDIGNGNNSDMEMLMPKDIPIHIICLMRTCLLLTLIFFTHLSIWHNDFRYQIHTSMQLSHFVPATKFSLIYSFSL